LNDPFAAPDPTGPTAEVPMVAPAVGLDLNQFSYELSIYIGAPPPKVFGAFVNEIDRWWTFRLRDRTRCTIEPWVGGRWMQEWDNGGALFGNFTVFDPPRLLCIAGPLAMSRAAQNLLQFEFDPADTGTSVVITHQAFGDFDPDTAEIYRNGWDELIGSALRDFVDRM
jgi:uncharacterized protein YndB with AHSA1/START domain